MLRSLQVLLGRTLPLAQVPRSLQEVKRGAPPLAPPWNKRTSGIGRRSSIFFTLEKITPRVRFATQSGARASSGSDVEHCSTTSPINVKTSMHLGDKLSVN